MGAISIRGIDEQLSMQLKQKAGEEKKSVNQLVLEILRRDLGLEKKRRFTKEYNDLDDLFGRWNKDEYENIQKEIDLQRGIDEELWK